MYSKYSNNGKSIPRTKTPYCWCHYLLNLCTRCLQDTKYNSVSFNWLTNHYRGPNSSEMLDQHWHMADHLLTTTNMDDFRGYLWPELEERTRWSATGTLSFTLSLTLNNCSNMIQTSNEPIHSLEPRKDEGLSPISTSTSWILCRLGTTKGDTTEPEAEGGVTEEVVGSLVVFLPSAQEHRDWRLR